MFTFAKQTRGFSAISKTALSKIAVPEREEVSARWKGVKHVDLVNETVTAIERSGLKLKSEDYVVSKDEHDLVATFEILPKSAEHRIPGTVPIVGLTHSNMGRRSMQLFAGARVLVCSNGMVSQQGSIVLAKKHTTGFDLTGALDDGLIEWKNRVQKVLPAFYQKMVKMPVDDKQVDQLLMHCARTNLLPFAELGKVDEAWRKPPHKDFAPRNAWSLYNAFTEPLKDRSVDNQMKTFAWLAREVEKVGSFN